MDKIPCRPALFWIVDDICEGDAMRIDSHQIDSLLKIVLNETGMDLSGYRRPTLSRRISERLARLGTNAEEYIALCRDDEEECRALVNSVAINVSSFFRNPAVFEILAQSILPRLVDQGTAELRVWSAGCAAGEEAYSMAMLILRELKRSRNADCRPMIFATDIDGDVLKKAKKAIYSRESMKDTKLGFVDEYFSHRREDFSLCSGVKKLVSFSSDDLLSEHNIAPAASIYGAFDIVLCRNVLIYFSAKHQEQIFKRLYKSLSKGGYLVLGDSEVLCGDSKTLFKVFDEKNKIYQK
jgi:chemotaxis methyl-accepting protein methylase